jgi:hypothetical protein
MLLLAPIAEWRGFQSAPIKRGPEVKQRQAGVMLDGEPPVGDRDESIASHSQDFADEPQALFASADMLEHRVGEHDVEFLIGEGQRVVGRDLDVSKVREGSQKIPTVTEAQVIMCW